jgi:nitrogen regulatory protein PII
VKLIIALIKPFKLEEVRDALSVHALGGMTVTEAKVADGQNGRIETFRLRDSRNHLVPKAQIEIAVTDGILERTKQEIIRAASTGRPGDGTIFVLPLEAVIRIRTEERDDNAV